MLLSQALYVARLAAWSGDEMIPVQNRLGTGLELGTNLSSWAEGIVDLAPFVLLGAVMV